MNKICQIYKCSYTNLDRYITTNFTLTFFGKKFVVGKLDENRNHLIGKLPNGGK